MNMLDMIRVNNTSSFWYEREDAATDFSDPLLEASGSTKPPRISTLGTLSSSSSLDTVDFSQTNEFFAKLKELARNDPETFKELFQKLGQTLKNAKGYAGHILSNLSQAVADGADVTDVIV